MRECPLCGSYDASFISHLEYVVFDDSPISPVYDLISCNVCGFSYCDTIVTTDNLKRYYSENKHYLSGGAGNGSSGETARYLAMASIIQKYRKDHDATIVDVGSAGCGLLSFLYKRGYKNLVAVDLLPSGTSFKTVIGMVEDMPLPDKSADIVFLSHVLEHTLNLKGATKEIGRILSDEGLVYVEVPVFGKDPTFDKAVLWDYPYEHINYFTEGHLLLLFLNNGFTLLETGNSYIIVEDGVVRCVYAVFTKIHQPSLIQMPVFQNLQPLIKYKIPCYLWGISQYTLLLLGSTNLMLCNIVGLLDTSEYKQSKTIQGIKIESPDILKGSCSDTVVIYPSEPYGKEMNAYLDKIKFKGKRVELIDGGKS
jgi:SAM-dependent methyltransferase